MNFKSNYFFMGLILVVIGINMPIFVNVYNFGIYSLISSDIINIIKASLLLVLLNIIRAIPHYLGAFLISESFKTEKSIINDFLTIFIIFFVYKLINIFYGIQYDFGFTAMSIFVGIVIIVKMRYKDIYKRAILLILILCGCQWLDIIPIITKFGFGKGEISLILKNLMILTNSASLVSSIAISFFIIFITNAIFIGKILENHENQIIILKNQEKLNKELSEARLAFEVQTLLHDLKTPITAIEGILSSLELIAENENFKKYVNKAVFLTENLNAMVSEMLKEDYKTRSSIDEITNYILAQITPYVDIQNIIVENKSPDNKIEINKIHFTRVIINLIIFSYKSLVNNKDSIYFKMCEKNNRIIFEISHSGNNIYFNELKENLINQSIYKFINQVIISQKAEIEIKNENNLSKVLISVRL